MMTIQWHRVLLVCATISLAGCAGAETSAEQSREMSTGSGVTESTDASEEETGAVARETGVATGEDTELTAGTVGPTSESSSGLGLDCPVDDAAVGRAVDTEIVAIDPDIGGVGSSEGFSFAYAGCRFTTDDGTEFTVASLVDENGEPTVAPIAAMSEATQDPANAPAVGDDSFFTRRGVLAVLAGDRTFTVEMKGVRLQDSDRPRIVAMAQKVVTSDATDPAGRCQVFAAGVPTGWGPAGDRPLRGAGSSGGVDYRSCRVTLGGLDGASVQLNVSEGHGLFDDLDADQATFDARAPQPVTELGDVAFRYGSEEHLLVRIADRGWVLSGRTSTGEAADPELVSALASAILPAT